MQDEKYRRMVKKSMLGAAAILYVAGISSSVAAMAPSYSENGSYDAVAAGTVDGTFHPNDTDSWGFSENGSYTAVVINHVDGSFQGNHQNPEGYSENGSYTAVINR